MNDSAYHRLQEASWRRKLGTAEKEQLQAHLNAHSEARQEWESDAGLTDLLNQLPNVPVSSNFTARVLQEINREQLKAGTLRRRVAWHHAIRWFPRAALALVVAGAMFLSFRQYQLSTRSQIAHSVAAVSTMATLPRMEWLQNFDAINRLTQATPMDDELLALLK